MSEDEKGAVDPTPDATRPPSPSSELGMRRAAWSPARSAMLRRRVRAGELGSIPVVIGLIVIWIVFYLLDRRSSRRRTSPT